MYTHSLSASTGKSICPSIWTKKSQSWKDVETLNLVWRLFILAGRSSIWNATPSSLTNRKNHTYEHFQSDRLKIWPVWYL